MRKILLTTTALVAFGLTNAAVAETMSHVEKGLLSLAVVNLYIIHGLMVQMIWVVQIIPRLKLKPI